MLPHSGHEQGSVVKYRRTFAVNPCQFLPSVAVDHRKPRTFYAATVPLRVRQGLLTEFWYDPECLDLEYCFGDSFADSVCDLLLIVLQVAPL